MMMTMILMIMLRLMIMINADPDLPDSQEGAAKRARTAYTRWDQQSDKVCSVREHDFLDVY